MRYRFLNLPSLPLLTILACKPVPAPSPARGTTPDAAARPAAAAVAPVIEVEVTNKGFEPPRVQVAAGKPLVLRFTRKVAETCADAVDLQGDPVRHMLPLDRPVDVKLTAPASGEVAFACPMRMYRGAVVVKQPGP